MCIIVFAIAWLFLYGLYFNLHKMFRKMSNINCQQFLINLAAIFVINKNLIIRKVLIIKIECFYYNRVCKLILDFFHVLYYILLYTILFSFFFFTFFTFIQMDILLMQNTKIRIQTILMLRQFVKPKSKINS